MENVEVAVFGGGCFWCTEAIFKSLRGVESVEPGYAGGYKENPTYEEVCTETTGHAEVIKIGFNSKQISYRTLLTVFFATHDPSSLNRQGADVGTQYRSVILTTKNEQRIEAEKFIKELNDSSEIGEPIVTEVKPLNKFYLAEDYHRNYFSNHKNVPYCQAVINPKLAKLKEKFATLLENNHE